MKRFLAVLIGVVLINSCDDGDLVVETIDFADVTAQRCANNGLLFKIKSQESLILNFPKDAFSHSVDTLGTSSNVISKDYQVVYNFYNGPVGAGNICDLIAPAFPVVSSQWVATSGAVEINKTYVKILDEKTNSTKITGINNNIIFKKITFNKGDGTKQFYETFVFGDYPTETMKLPFNFKDELDFCPVTNRIYKTSTSSESLTLDFDQELIANAVTPEGQPRVGKIGDNGNKLVYQIYGGVISDPDYFCKEPIPLEPKVLQTWLGRTGGTIEVTTTTDGNAFKHTIVLKNVILERGEANFNLGNSYPYGYLIKL